MTLLCCWWIVATVDYGKSAPIEAVRWLTALRRRALVGFLCSWRPWTGENSSNLESQRRTLSHIRGSRSPLLECARPIPSVAGAPIDPSKPPVNLRTLGDVMTWLNDPRQESLWVHQMDLCSEHGNVLPWHTSLTQFAKEYSSVKERLAVTLIEVNGRAGPLLRMRTDKEPNPSAPDGRRPRGNMGLFWAESLDGRAPHELSTEKYRRMTIIGVFRKTICYWCGQTARTGGSSTGCMPE
jgi:hypothetical protein